MVLLRHVSAIEWMKGYSLRGTAVGSNLLVILVSAVLCRSGRSDRLGAARKIYLYGDEKTPPMIDYICALTPLEQGTSG